MHTQQIYEHSPSNSILFIWESPEKEEKYLQQIHAGKLTIFLRQVCHLFTIKVRQFDKYFLFGYFPDTQVCCRREFSSSRKLNSAVFETGHLKTLIGGIARLVKLGNFRCIPVHT